MKPTRMTLVAKNLAGHLKMGCLVVLALSVTRCDKSEPDSPDGDPSPGHQGSSEQPFVLGPIPVVPTTNSVSRGSPQPLAAFDLLKSQASQVFTVFCVSCHNPNRQEGQLGNLQDLDRLATNTRFIVAGQPDRSLLVEWLSPHGGMKKDEAPSLGHRETIRRWIKSLPAAGTP